MGRGKKRQSKRQPRERQGRQRTTTPATAPTKSVAAAEAKASSTFGPADIPWTADRPQPVRRAFGVFKVGKIDFIGRQKVFLVFSGVLLLASVLSLLFRGLNYGIDFTGGNSYALRFEQAVGEADVRGVLETVNVRGAVIRVDRDDPKEALVRTPYLDIEAETAMFEALEVRYPGVQAASGDAVSPTIGGDLLRNSLWATGLACILILVYVAVRFEYRFAVAGVLALVHDSLITVGVFSVLRLDVDAAFVAAILTVIGYSINDTVVVFDRIRDNLKRRGKEGLEALANRSVNETFVRSINTNLTAFLAVAAIFFFGGATTKDFSLALMVGILIGSYSTICVATPVWLWWRKRDERLRARESSRTVNVRPRTARG